MLVAVATVFALHSFATSRVLIQSFQKQGEEQLSSFATRDEMHDFKKEMQAQKGLYESLVQELREEIAKRDQLQKAFDNLQLKVLHQQVLEKDKQQDNEDQEKVQEEEDTANLSEYVVTVTQEIPAARPRRKVVILGPHDRFNFGDLLFTKVLKKLLITRANYTEDEIIAGGMVDIDMTPYQGEERIYSMKTVIQMSQNDKQQGPYDIIYAGGESVGCSFEFGTSMMQTEELKSQAMKNRVPGWDCAYLVPKELLHPVDSIHVTGEGARTNHAIVNSMGGTPSSYCMAAITTADYEAYRDKDPLFPDSAVMTKELYSDEISKVAEDVLKEIFNNEEPQPYTACQFHDRFNEQKKAILAGQLDIIAQNTNTTIVFFMAGSAPRHDSIKAYEDVASMMSMPSVVYKGEGVWNTVAVISRAEAVVATSLHVRIMSTIFFKPRLTWCSGNKHRFFIEKWDASDAADCTSFEDTWSVLKSYVGPDPEFDQESTKVKYPAMIDAYLQSFDSFSKILSQG